MCQNVFIPPCIQENQTTSLRLKNAPPLLILPRRGRGPMGLISYEATVKYPTLYVSLLRSGTKINCSFPNQVRRTSTPMGEMPKAEGVYFPRPKGGCLVLIHTKRYKFQCLIRAKMFSSHQVCKKTKQPAYG